MTGSVGIPAGPNRGSRTLIEARRGFQPRRLRFVTGNSFGYPKRSGRGCKLRPAWKSETMSQ